MAEMAWYFNLFVYLWVCPSAAFRNQENETRFESRLGRLFLTEL